MEANSPRSQIIHCIVTTQLSQTSKSWRFLPLKLSINTCLEVNFCLSEEGQQSKSHLKFPALFWALFVGLCGGMPRVRTGVGDLSVNATMALGSEHLWKAYQDILFSVTQGVLEQNICHQVVLNLFKGYLHTFSSGCYSRTEILDYRKPTKLDS